MYSYLAYGLVFRSELEIPELTPVAPRGEPDVLIRRGPITWRPADLETTASDVAPALVHLYFAETGAFRIRAGREITIDAEPGGGASVVRLCLLGPVLASLLHQRGLLVLHASAVAIGPRAVAFVGARGWGKSTMAAHMQALGYPLLADDVVAVDTSDATEIRLFPGYPQVKLWPDAARHFGIAPEAMAFLQPRLPKRGLRFDRGFSTEPVRLSTVYVLGVADEIGVERLSGREAFVELLAHSYLARHIEATGACARHFAQCADLARRLDLFALRRPRALSALVDVARCVLDQFSTDDGATTSRTA